MAISIQKGDAGGGRGRSLVVMSKEVMEGYISLNPLVLKKFDASAFKEMHQQLRKLQTTVRSEGVDLTNQEATRIRNQKMQRLHQAMSVLEIQAKLKKIILG